MATSRTSNDDNTDSDVQFSGDLLQKMLATVKADSVILQSNRDVLKAHCEALHASNQLLSGLNSKLGALCNNLSSPNGCLDKSENSHGNYQLCQEIEFSIHQQKPSLCNQAEVTTELQLYLQCDLDVKSPKNSDTRNQLFVQPILRPKTFVHQSCGKSLKSPSRWVNLQFKNRGFSFKHVRKKLKTRRQHRLRRSNESMWLIGSGLNVMKYIMRHCSAVITNRSGKRQAFGWKRKRKKTTVSLFRHAG
jgi:hypothetical protein